MDDGFHASEEREREREGFGWEKEIDGESLLRQMMGNCSPSRKGKPRITATIWLLYVMGKISVHLASIIACKYFYLIFSTLEAQKM